MKFYIIFVPRRLLVLFLDLVNKNALNNALTHGQIVLQFLGNIRILEVNWITNWLLF